MIHQLTSKTYKPEYSNEDIKQSDLSIMFIDNKVLMVNKNNNLTIPTFKETINFLDTFSKKIIEPSIYLFSIEDKKFFLNQVDLIVSDEELDRCDFSLESTQIFRSLKPQWSAFAGITALHLYRFYRNNKYCGRCGKETIFSPTERSITCSCGNTNYPPISPAVIVGLIDRKNDKILMSKYAGREYKNYALLAGFGEIGEDLETTVRREVFEEVGLKVKNIKYYKSQPWGFSSSILMGFFAELDGPSKITLDKEELSEAGWYSKDEVPLESEPISLTYEMMKVFKENNI